MDIMKLTVLAKKYRNRKAIINHPCRSEYVTKVQYYIQFFDFFWLNILWQVQFVSPLSLIQRSACTISVYRTAQWIFVIADNY